MNHPPLKLGNIRLARLEPFIEVWDEVGKGSRRPELINTEPVDTRRESSFGGILNQQGWKTEFAKGLMVEWRIAPVPGREAWVFEQRIGNSGEVSVRIDGLGLKTAGTGDFQVPGPPGDWTLSFHKDTPTASLADRLPSRNDRIRAMWKSFGQESPPFPLIEETHFDDGRWRKFRDWFTLTCESDGLTLAGAAVGDVADVDFDFYIDPDAGHALEITSRMSGIQLDPGEWREGDRVILAFGEYDDVLPWIFRWMGDTLGTRLHRPPLVGWCSWYDLYRGVSAEDVRQVTEAAGGFRDRIPLDVIQIDDGYQRQLGEWEPNEKFPDGLEPLCEKIEQAGSSPAVWIAPLFYSDAAGRNNLGAEDRPLSERHPEWFQRDAQGRLIGKGEGWGKPHHLLDPSHPKAQALIRQMLRRLKASGFRYFKIDFNTLQEAIAWDPMVPRFHDEKKTRFQIFRDLYRLYRETLGEDVYILSCVCELIRGPIGFADAQRIGPDSDAVWTGKANKCCLDACIEAVFATAQANGILTWADPDVTYLRERGHKGPPLTVEEFRSWHSLVGLLGGPVFISEPLQKAAYQEDDALRALEILTPPLRDRAIPIHGGSRSGFYAMGTLSRRPWGDHALLWLHNPKDVPEELPVNWDAVGITQSPFHLWSFWDEVHLGRHKDGSQVSVSVPAHGCRVLRITPAPESPRPVLVGSTLHISVGSTEVDELIVHENSKKPANCTHRFF